MDASLLDTDILNEVLKQKNANAIRHAADYLAQHGQFAISSSSRYEVLRGLKEKNAISQLARCQTSARTHWSCRSSTRSWTERRICG